MRITKEEIISKVFRKEVSGFSMYYEAEIFGVTFKFLKFKGDKKYQLHAWKEGKNTVLSLGVGYTKRECIDLLYQGLNNLYPECYYEKTVQELIKDV